MTVSPAMYVEEAQDSGTGKFLKSLSMFLQDENAIYQLTIIQYPEGRYYNTGKDGYFIISGLRLVLSFSVTRNVLWFPGAISLPEISFLIIPVEIIRA